MSPPSVACGTSLQEGLEIINNIADLDSAVTNKENNLKTLAVENLCEDNVKVKEEKCERRLSSEVMHGVEECCQSLKDAKRQEGYIQECVELVDLSHDCRTPDCLGKDGEEVLEKSHSVCEPQSTESHPVLCKRKRRKNRKGSKRQRTKKRKTSLSSSELVSCIDQIDQNTGCCKTVGGTTTKQTCQNNGSGQCTNTSAACSTVNNALKQGGCGAGGGGGAGDGGEEGDDPRKGKKISAHNSSFQGGNVKKNAKKKTASGDKSMEVDGSSSKDSAMDVSSPSRPTDVQMETANSHAIDEEQAGKPAGKPPDNKPPVHEMKPPSQDYLIHWDLRINHSTVCKLLECIKCQWVKKAMEHYLKRDNGCQNCDNCKMWQIILDFHQQKCPLATYCHVCLKLKNGQNNQTVHSGKNAGIVQNLQQMHVQHVQVEQMLNVPTSGRSLDQSEGYVIYWDDGLRSLKDIKEHEHYSFKEHGLVGKGGNGCVYDIVPHNKLKETYSNFIFKDLVVKKAIVGKEEIATLKAISNHPNFVKTLAVVNKCDGKFTHRIFMEKCDTSLRKYLDLKTIDKYEAMHYWTQVLDAVVYLHNRRIPIIHKDIKSGNVLLTFETNLVRAKLADFDAVKLLHNEFTQPGLQVRGTPPFIAPEVLRCEPHGRPADIYSLGMLLLELLLCRSDLQDPKLAIQKLKNIDLGLGCMVEQCLQDNPDHRPTAIGLRESYVKEVM